MSALRGLACRLADRDANEERRYLHSGDRVHLTWSWLWLSWAFGVGVEWNPYRHTGFPAIEAASHELGGVWLMLGPLCVEVYVTQGGAA